MTATTKLTAVNVYTVISATIEMASLTSLLECWMILAKVAPYSSGDWGSQVSITVSAPVGDTFIGWLLHGYDSHNCGYFFDFRDTVTSARCEGCDLCDWWLLRLL